MAGRLGPELGRAEATRPGSAESLRVLSGVGATVGPTATWPAISHAQGVSRASRPSGLWPAASLDHFAAPREHLQSGRAIYYYLGDRSYHYYCRSRPFVFISISASTKVALGGRDKWAPPLPARVHLSDSPSHWLEATGRLCLNLTDFHLAMPSRKPSHRRHH